MTASVTRPLFRMVPYRVLQRIDWLMLALAAALIGFGIVTLWGSTSAAGDGPGPLRGYALRQLRWAAIGLVPLVFLIVLDYRKLQPVIWIIYGLQMALLAGLLFKGETIKGARSWYDLGAFNFQPSEPGKLVVILALAHCLSHRMDRFGGLRSLPLPLAIVGFPVWLILKQPDLGSAMVLVPVAGAMLWVAGLHKWIVLVALIAAAGGAVATYPHLRPYQKDRIQTFLNPEADPLGRGYNIIQSETALGSGQLLGKGWGRGTQTNFNFLPEFHTDFIFPTVGEQFGLVGSSLLLLMTTLLVLLLLRLANQTHDLFGMLIVVGVATLFATHVFFNIGMTIGLMPITGLPLPFFSYGGSFMLTCMASVGLAVGIGARRGL